MAKSKLACSSSWLCVVRMRGIITAITTAALLQLSCRRCGAIWGGQATVAGQPHAWPLTSRGACVSALVPASGAIHRLGTVEPFDHRDRLSLPLIGHSLSAFPSSPLPLSSVHRARHIRRLASIHPVSFRSVFPARIRPMRRTSGRQWLTKKKLIGEIITAVP